MDRKQFLQTTGLVAAGCSLPRHNTFSKPHINKTYKVPPYLAPGAVIGITAPAGFITLEEMQPAIQVLESWGYKIKIGTTIDKRDFTFGGTDDERRNDLQHLLDDVS